MAATATDERARLNALTLAAFGVVFGDIGTAPLYVRIPVMVNARIGPS